MHKEGEDSLTLALTPFTIVTNSKSPIHVYIHIFIKTLTKIKIRMDIFNRLRAYSLYLVCYGHFSSSSSFLPLRRPPSIFFFICRFFIQKLKFKPLVIYDHALIWWLFLDLRTGEILTFRSLKMNKFLKAFNANLKRVRRESFIKIKSGKKNIIQ